MEHVWNTLNDLLIFMVMILLGGITWFLSNFILSKKGGDGIVTCMLEEVFGLDLLKYI